MSLTFITGNKAKAEQLSRHLNFLVDHHDFDLEEIQSLDLNEIVEEKVKTAFKRLGTPVLVEDVSLTFHALGKLPGPLIKWFFTELGNDGLCELLNNYKDRKATATVMFGYYDGQVFKTFSGQIKGEIIAKPRGTSGFGWDPIFKPTGYSQSWGEMNTADQKASSMRRIALKKLGNFLKTIKN